MTALRVPGAPLIVIMFLFMKTELTENAVALGVINARYFDWKQWGSSYCSDWVWVRVVRVSTEQKQHETIWNTNIARLDGCTGVKVEVLRFASHSVGASSNSGQFQWQYRSSVATLARTHVCRLNNFCTLHPSSIPCQVPGCRLAIQLRSNIVAPQIWKHCL